MLALGDGRGARAHRSRRGVRAGVAELVVVHVAGDVRRTPASTPMA